MALATKILIMMEITAPPPAKGVSLLLGLSRFNDGRGNALNPSRPLVELSNERTRLEWRHTYSKLNPHEDKVRALRQEGAWACVP